MQVSTKALLWPFLVIRDLFRGFCSDPFSVEVLRSSCVASCRRLHTSSTSLLKEPAVGLLTPKHDVTPNVVLEGTLFSGFTFCVLEFQVGPFTPKSETPKNRDAPPPDHGSAGRSQAAVSDLGKRHGWCLVARTAMLF